MELSRFSSNYLSCTIKKTLPTSENSICQAACARSPRWVSKWTLLSTQILAADLTAASRSRRRGDVPSFWAWSINHPVLKLQSVRRFQLRMNVVAPARDTARGLMWGLYFSSWRQTGEAQPSIILINDESWGWKNLSLDPAVLLWAQDHISMNFILLSLYYTEKSSSIKRSVHPNDENVFSCR